MRVFLDKLFRGRHFRGRPAFTMAIAGMAAAFPACAQPQDLAPASAETGSLVQLGLSYTRALAATPAPTSTIEAEAHFVRYRAADHAMDRTVVAGLLGFGNAGDESLAVDACRNDIGEVTAAPSAGAIEVSLLDAGPLTVRTRDLAGARSAPLAKLEAQHYPELFPFVSGVVYGLEATPTADLLPGARVEIEADGGEDVGPFLAAAQLPSAFPDLAVARDATSGRVDLRWAAADPALAKTASVLVELRWGGTQPGTLHCRARDDGRFTIERAQAPGLEAALGSVGSFTGQAGAQVSVARSARTAMQAPGAGDGTLTVSLRDTATLLGAEQP